MTSGSSGKHKVVKAQSQIPTPPTPGSTPQLQKISHKGVAVAAAKSLQSCLTLCDPIDGSPPGSSVPEILQARVLEWVETRKLLLPFLHISCGRCRASPVPALWAWFVTWHRGIYQGPHLGPKVILLCVHALLLFSREWWLHRRATV